MKFAYIQERRYEIAPIGDEWWNLSCNGTHIAKLVSEEECRRVIWTYWTNLGVILDPLTEDDFDATNE